ncbi:MAG: deoxyguanosinetriphosphate triphosphohydrolase [Gammaproteobacteria bacterium]|nr:deoxyguanosinetriphosphate triphosphohydrolase [Gammaproteobacteria bacterium]
MLNLAPYAANDKNSRGRRHPEAIPTYRSQFQRDRDRIIHSAAFRRLEYKTQVFVNHEGDMFRTRLTHSIEVAQLSRTIARILQLNEELCETIALAHDLGHTPFGHAGQEVLNQCMLNYGGFEHNLQSLRTVDELEERYAEFRGLNLTFESREGILKHCSLKNAEALTDVGQRFIDKTQPSLEAQAVNLADEIAYNNHDVDDGLRSGLIQIEQLLDIRLFRDQYDEVTARYKQLNGRQLIYEIIRRMINRQVVDLVETSKTALKTHSPADIDAVRQHDGTLINFSEDMQAANLQLKQFLRKELYQHYRVHRMSAKAGRIIHALFGAFMDDPLLLKPEHQQTVKNAEREDGDHGRARTVADYVAGMTDRYAISEYRRIFDPEELT